MAVKVLMMLYLEVRKFINFLINKNDTNILVVTHSGFLFALFKYYK